MERLAAYMNIKVVLVNPKADEDILNNLPLGLCYLAAVVKKMNHVVEVIDLNSIHTREDLINTLLNGVDILGITTTAPAIYQVLDIAKMVKTFSPHTRVFLGGPHATFAYENILLRHHEVDFVIIGEGENVLAHVLEAYSGGCAINGIPGVAYRDSRGRVIAIPASKCEDIDSYPMPLRNCVESSVSRAKRKGIRHVVSEIITARGCPGHCSFCVSNVNTCIRWRHRDINSVEKEIGYLVEQGSDGLYFVDVDFFASHEHAENVIGLIRKFPQVTQIFIVTRVASLLREKALFLKLLDMGLSGVEVGIESGAQTALDRYNKNITVQENIDAMEFLNECKRKRAFVVTCDMIMFDPMGSYEELWENYTMMQKCDMTNKEYEECLFTCLYFLPGSDLYNRNLSDGTIGPSLDVPYISFADSDVANIYAYAVLYKQCLLPKVRIMRTQIREILTKPNEADIKMQMVGLAVQMNGISFRYFKELMDTRGDRAKMTIIYDKYANYVDENFEKYGR